MFASASRQLEPLQSGHPCQGCEARGKAVCGVLDCANLAQLRNLGSSLKLSAGQVLFHEGDQTTRVFTLTRGVLKLYKLLADGRRHIAGFMYAGDFLGISVDDKHAFSAEALEASQLCCFARDHFDDFIDAHPAMERELYCMAAHELAVAQQQLVLLGRKTAAERIATFLLLRAEQSETASGEKTSVVDLAMSRSDIADFLGLTKETVSRVFSAFRASRVIRLQALDRVEILDRPSLERLAEWDG